MKGDSKNGQAGQPHDFPFSKRVVAEIKTTPLKSAQKKPPAELAKALKKTLGTLGLDYARDQAIILSVLTQRFEREFKGATMADAFEHTDRILSEIMLNCITFSATVPIALRHSAFQKSEIIGSGALIRIMDRTFLLTAAHILDRQTEGDLLIPGKNGFMALQGCFSFMKLPASGLRDDDRLDVAYWWLDAECVAELHSDLMVLERPGVSLEAKPTLRSSYTIAGYPWRKSNVTTGRIETQFQTITGAEASASEYKSAGLDRSLHMSCLS